MRASCTYWNCCFWINTAWHATACFIIMMVCTCSLDSAIYAVHSHGSRYVFMIIMYNETSVQRVNCENSQIQCVLSAVLRLFILVGPLYALLCTGHTWIARQRSLECMCMCVSNYTDTTLHWSLSRSESSSSFFIKTTRTAIIHKTHTDERKRSASDCVRVCMCVNAPHRMWV